MEQEDGYEVASSILIGGLGKGFIFFASGSQEVEAVQFLAAQHF
jgi:hypothetical protein